MIIIKNIIKFFKKHWYLPAGLAVAVIVLILSFILFRKPVETYAAWYNYNWSYRQSYPITYSGGSELTEYQVFIDDLDTAALIGQNKMQADCDDIRFVDSSGNVLSYFIAGATCNTSDTEIWVKTESIPTNGTTFYFYYGNPAADSYQSEENTFSYSEEKAIAYVLNDSATSMDLISLADGNTITHNSVTRSLDDRGTSNFTSMDTYGTVSAKKLFFMAHKDYDTVVPISWAGNEFIMRNRNRAYVTYFLMVSPWGTATVQIYVDGVKCGADRTVTDSGLKVTDCGNAAYDVIRIVSDLPILVNKSGNGADPYPMHPATVNPLYGWDSNQDNLGSGANGADYRWIDSGDSTANDPANLGANIGTAIGAGGGSYYNGVTVKVWSEDYPIGVSSCADSDGGDATYYVERTAFGTKFGSPYATDFVSVVSDQAATCSTYTDGVLTETQTLTSNNSQVFALPSSTFGLGNSNVYINGIWTVECDKPVYVVAQYTDDEQNMWSWSMMRQFTYPTPAVGSATSEEAKPVIVGFWKFNEGYGTIAHDSSVNNNIGTITTADWKPSAQCISNNCLWFNGVDDLVTVSENSNLTFTAADSFTKEAWVKTNQLGTAQAILDQEDVHLGLNANNEFYTNIGGSALNSNIQAEIGQWYHLAVTYASTTVKIYVNGELQNTGTRTLASQTGSNFLIGDDGSNKFKGFIDEVIVFPEARTLPQILSDYNAGLSGGSSSGGGFGGGFGQSSNQWATLGLQTHLKMDESSWTDDCSTETLGDATGNGNGAKACPNASGPGGGADGKYYYGGYFDGDDDYIDLPAINTIGPYGTYSFWIKPSSINVSEGWIDTGSNFDIFQWSGSLVYFRPGNSADQKSVSISNWNAGTWHHVAMTWDQNNFKGYLDGQLVTSGPKNSSFSGDIYLGRVDSNYYYHGYLDDVRIYNRKLPQEEIHDLYAFTLPPIAYWDFEEGQGTNLYDKSGNGNDSASFSGSLGDNSDWKLGKFGSSLDFDGTDDYITIGNVLNMGTRDFTVSAWVKTSDASQDTWYRRIYGKGYSGDGYSTYVYTDGTIQYISNSQASNSTNTAINDGQWHHVATVRASSTVKIFINGIMEVNQTNAAWNADLDNSENFTIGVLTDGGTTQGHWHGQIDDLKVFNYARTPQQILLDVFGGQTAGPVGYWGFEKGYGTTAEDKSIFNNNATLTNMSSAGTSTAWTVGKMGKALKFDGENDHLAITDTTNSPLDVSLIASLSAWIKPATVSGDQYIIDKDQSSAYALMISDSTLYGYFDIGGSNSCSGGIIVPNVWQHVVATYDGAYIKCYVNGQLVNQTAVSGTIDVQDNSIYIGSDGGSANYFKGLIDEVKIYNYNLANSDIFQDYNQNKTVTMGALDQGRELQEGLVGWWKMDESVSAWDGDGDQINDFSGNFNHCTSVNTAKATTTARYGNAGKFDGDSDYLNCTDVANMGTSDFTLGAWIKTNSSANYQPIFYKDDNTNGFSLSLTNSGYPYAYLRNNGAAAVFSNYQVDLRDNNWHYLAAVFDRDNYLTMYVDGESVGILVDISNLIGNIFNGNNLQIGYSAGSNYYAGLIDDAKIYVTARTPDQIMQDYLVGPPPIAHWDFEENQGTYLYDKSGHGNNSTSFQGDPAWTLGKYGAGLEFDGGDDYVAISDSIMDCSKDFSISMWVKPDNNAANPRWFSQITAVDNLELGHIDADNIYFRLDDVSTQTSNYTLDYHDWYHIAWVYNNGIPNIYVDGQKKATEVGGISANATFSAIGGGYSPTSYNADADLDEVKIFDYALSPWQVADDFNKGAPVAFYKLNTQSGTTIYDYSINKNDGLLSLNGSPEASSAWQAAANCKLNACITLDGTDDYISVTDSTESALDVSEQATLSAWIYPTTVSGDQYIIDKDQSSAYSLMISGSTLYGYFDVGGSNSCSGGNISVNTWQHVAAIYDGNYIKCYINGELVNKTSDSGSIDVQDTTLYLGADGGAANYFTGRLDEIRIYNYARSSKQIKEDVNLGYGTYFK